MSRGGSNVHSIPRRGDLTISFDDDMIAMDEDIKISPSNIHNSAQIYMHQLQLKAETPFRSENSLLGNQASGEQDCCVMGIAYTIRPIDSSGIIQNFSIKDFIDVLDGIDYVATRWSGIAEGEVKVLFKWYPIAIMNIRRQFRGLEPAPAKCLEYHPGNSIQEVAMV